ncbi:MAG TPA: kelch repeat-containing protein [Gemmataceae bacterium]|nr:kelch repeat-containing protein [Gemmataceae bacterium]
MLAAWTTVAPLPTPHADLGGVLGSNGLVYAIGGYNSFTALNTVQAYNPGTNLWTSVPSLHTARGGLAAAAGLDGRIYAISGGDSTIMPMNSVEVYKPSVNSWTTVAPIPTGRVYLAAATGPGGIIYAIGGANSAGKAVTTVEAYNPQTNTWVARASMNTARIGPSAAVGSDGRIYVFGGVPAFKASAAIPTVESYNPLTNKWTFVANMLTAVAYAGATQGPNGRLYVVGGDTADFFANNTNVVESYNPNTNTWRAEVSLPTARGDLAAVLGYDGRIYAFGGTNGTSAAVTTNQVYQGASGFAAFAATKLPASATSADDSGTPGPVSLTVSQLPGITMQPGAPNSGANGPSSGSDGIQSVLADGSHGPSADLADALFANIMG